MFGSGRFGNRRFAKSCFCLIVIACWILAAPISMCGQDRLSSDSVGNDRLSAAAEFAPASPPSRLAPRLRPGGISIAPNRPRPFPGSPGNIGLGQLTRAAGTIFSGKVTAIARAPSSADAAVETVAITFHVERALRGAIPGQDLTIFEWTGLWTSGQRYRIGERVLLFLFPPSKLGLTSCVAGTLGRFSIDPAGRIVLSDQHLAAFGADPALRGKSRVTLRDFAQAVLRTSGEE